MRFFFEDAGRVERKELGMLQYITADITMRQWEALRRLSTRKEWSIAEVAEELGISSPAATKFMQRLERKGMVTRTKNKVDLRGILISLTPSGQSILRITTSS